MNAARTLEVFVQFLYLGCTSFGGPAAHIGYFRRLFVEQKAWLSADEFASKLALCQFLPGPSSSQLGFAIACQRGGPIAGAAAFLGFTLPSFILMYLLAVAGSQFAFFQSGAAQGLKLLAAVVVADAIYSLARQFCRSPATASLTLISAALLLLGMTPLRQFALLVLAGVVMAVFAPRTKGVFQWRADTTARVSTFCFLMLLGYCFAFSEGLFAQFYQVGSAVFGGGHVVLPLLQSLLGDSLDADRFLTGYAAAQAVPGPMFSFAAYLGASLVPQAPLIAALVATAGIFLPGFLLLLALSPSWRQLSVRPRAQAAIAGVNAVAVGMLLAAWWGPVLDHAPHTPLAFVLGTLGFLALRTGRCPILFLILLFAGTGGWLW